MHKEEFARIVDRFNEDKVKNGWMSFLTLNTRNWERTKAKIPNYPTYYNFTNFLEFKFWLLNSENSDFIANRFCLICGKFIPTNLKTGIYTKEYPKGCCNEHAEQVRQNNLRNILLNRTSEEWSALHEKVKKTNLERYGVEHPLQNTDIHTKTITSGLKNNSYKKAVEKVKNTKLQKYGSENYNNSEAISNTKKSWTNTQKEQWLTRTKETKQTRYGNPKYNNSEKTKQTCLEKYGVNNVAKVEEVQNKIGEQSLATRVRNHTTVRELMQSTDKRYGNLTYQENFVQKVDDTKRKNNTTQKELFDSDIPYADGLTYKENFVQKVNNTKVSNNTTQRELFDSDKVLINGLTYKENFVQKVSITKHKNNTFNTSKFEIVLFDLFKQVYPDVETQYRAEEYPFNCDFCFPFSMSVKDIQNKKRVYFEYQGTWTHGNHPFGTDINDINILNIWKEKAKESDFYKNAIRVWTETDPQKRQVAKENKLDWYEVFSEKEFWDIWNRPDISYTGNDEVLKKVWPLFYKNELEWWKNPENKKKLYMNRYIYLGKVCFELTDSEILRAIGSIARYTPYFSRFEKGKNKMKELIKKDDIVFDPFGGWGDRFITAREIGCEYHYNDLNPELVKIWGGTCEDGFTYKPDINDYIVFSCPPYIIKDKLIEDYGVETSFDWKSFFKVHEGHKIILVLPEAMENDMPVQWKQKIPLEQNRTHFNKTNKKTQEFVYIWE